MPRLQRSRRPCPRTHFPPGASGREVRVRLVLLGGAFRCWAVATVLTADAAVQRHGPQASGVDCGGRHRPLPGWPTRGASRLASRTASTRPDRRREQAAAHSRSATRAQQMEASVETSAAVADARGPVRAAPWRRAARSTDAAASRCLALEDQSDREDGGWGRESDRAARWWRPSQATGSGALCGRDAP